MPNTELRRRLQELAQEFVDGVLGAIRDGALGEVAQEITAGRGNGAGALGRGATRALTPGSLRPGNGAGRRGARGVGVTIAQGARGSAAESSGARSSLRGRKLVRRPRDEIERVRTGILRALAKATAPIGAADIARDIGDVATQSLAFPMGRLRNAGLVTKQGERTQAVYSLTERGRAAVGGAKGTKGAKSDNGKAAKKGKKK